MQNRRIGSGRLIGEFCDVGRSASIVHLRAAFAARLSDYGLDDLDAGEIRLRVPRAFTKTSAVTSLSKQPGTPTYAGIRYGSRLGDDLTNWAIFEPNEPVGREQEEIQPDDPDLVRVLEDYGLALD